MTKRTLDAYAPSDRPEKAPRVAPVVTVEQNDDSFCTVADLVARMLASLRDFDSLMQFKETSKWARKSVGEALQRLLRPRYEALVAKLKSWATLPLNTPFDFPVNGGPMPVTSAKARSYGDRSDVRVATACPGEPLMDRRLFAWAVAQGFVLPQRFEGTDVDAALEACTNLYASCGPAHGERIDLPYSIMAQIKRGQPSPHLFYVRRWSRAHEYTVPALVMTFASAKYHGNPRLTRNGEPHNFLRTLLRQAWPNKEDLPDAIAFLLLWVQHVTFEAWAIDEGDFLYTAIQRIIVDFIFEWRNIKATPDCISDTDYLRTAETPAIYHGWFACDPASFAYTFDTRETLSFNAHYMRLLNEYASNKQYVGVLFKRLSASRA